MKTAHQAKRDVATSFKLAAPEAGEVFLAGEFNEWSATTTPMKRGSDGSWVATLELAPGRYEYKFVVDRQWICEPDCGGREGSSCVPNPFGSLNSVVEVA